jgi:hypothetical protein
MTKANKRQFNCPGLEARVAENNDFWALAQDFIRDCIFRSQRRIENTR